MSDFTIWEVFYVFDDTPCNTLQYDLIQLNFRSQSLCASFINGTIDMHPKPEYRVAVLRVAILRYCLLPTIVSSVCVWIINVCLSEYIC